MVTIILNVKFPDLIYEVNMKFLSMVKNEDVLRALSSIYDETDETLL